MIRFCLQIILNFFLFLIVRSQSEPCEFVPFTNPKISYEGRTGKDGASAILYWPGTQIEVNFIGTSIEAVFFDNTGKNYYNIIIDNDSILIFRPATVKQTYTLVSGLICKEHNLKIYKRTEWNKGTTYFYGFLFGNGSKISNPPQKKGEKLNSMGTR